MNYNLSVSSTGISFPEGIERGTFDVEVHQDGARRPEKINGVDGRFVPDTVGQYDGVTRVVLRECERKIV